MNEETDILVIGGGVIGFCSAYFLQEAGRQVTVLERDTICSGCSFGNSGLVVPSHCFPLAMPGVIRQSLKWMLNPESPFYIRPRFNPALFSWLWKFRAACTQERMRHAVRGLVDMSQSSIELYDDLMARGQLECGMTGAVPFFCSDRRKVWPLVSMRRISCMKMEFLTGR